MKKRKNKRKRKSVLRSRRTERYYWKKYKSMKMRTLILFDLMQYSILLMIEMIINKIS